MECIRLNLDSKGQLILIGDPYKENKRPFYRVICEFEDSEEGVIITEIIDYNLTKEQAEERKQDTINLFHDVHPRIIKQGERI